MSVTQILPPNALARLKQSIGASLVGFIQAGVGAVQRTIQAKAREVVSFADFATPQQALDSGARLVIIPDNYTVVVPAAGLTVPSGVSIEGRGINSVIDASGINDNVTGVLASGSVAGATTLTGNVAKNARVLPLASVAGITPGAWLLVRSSLDNSWSGFRTYRKQGFFQVQSVAGLNVTIAEETSTTFESASTVVELLDTTTATFRNFQLYTKETGDCTGLNILYGLNCIVEGVHQIGGKAVGLGCGNSINTTFRKCSSFLSAAAVDTQYAFAASSCDRTLIEDCEAYGTRHAVAVVGDQCRRTRVVRSRLKGALRAADIHGCGDGTVYEDCHIDGGITFGGRDSRYVNCDVIGQTNGIIQLASEIMGGTHEIVGGRYTFTGAAITAGWSPFDLGRGSAEITASTREDMVFRYVGAEIVIPSLAAHCIRIQNGSAFKANFDVRGLTINMPSAASVVRYEGTPTGADADFAIVDDIKINVAAQVPIFKQGAGASGYATTKMRMQQCVAEVAGAGALGDSTVALAFTYKFEYPKVPVVAFGYRGPRNPSGTAGKEIYVSLTAATILAATATVATVGGGTFGIAVTPAVGFHVGIAEL